MLKHHIPTQVIAAVFCFCIAGIFLGVNAQVIKSEIYYESIDGEYSAENLLIVTALGLISIVAMIGGIGFLKKRRWAVTLMTVLVTIGLALIIVAALAMLSNLINAPIDGILYLFTAIGLPLVALLFFSSVEIFPWAAKKQDEIHHDIIDHF
jgi:hypothetical protein